MRAGKNSGRWRALRAQRPGTGGHSAWGGDGARTAAVSSAPKEGEGANVAVIGDDWGANASGDDWGAAAGDDWAVGGDAA